MTQATLDQLKEQIEEILVEGEPEPLQPLLESWKEPEARFLLLEAALDLEDFDTVLEYLGPMIDPAEPGEDPRPWVLLGFVNYYRDDLEDAQEAFTVAQRIDSKNVRALLGRALVHREIDFIRAADLDLEKAMMLMEAVTDSSEDMDARGLKAELFNVKASFALEDEDTEGAVSALRIAAALSPQDASYPLDLGRLLSLEGELKPALEAVEQAIGRDGLLLEAFLLKSHLQGSLGLMEQSLATARTAVAMDDQEPYSLIQLCSVLMIDGRLEDALATAEKAIELDPEIPDGYQLKLAALHGLGRSGEATPEMEPYFEELADLPQFMYGPRFDPYAEAADALSGLTDLDPADLMNLADQFFASGQLPEALRPMMEQVMENLPELMQQMPGLFQMMPPELAGQLMPQDPNTSQTPSRPNLTVIPGGKKNDD